jgi:hypothetical protein
VYNESCKIIAVVLGVVGEHDVGRRRRDRVFEGGNGTTTTNPRHLHSSQPGVPRIFYPQETRLPYNCNSGRLEIAMN